MECSASIRYSASRAASAMRARHLDGDVLDRPHEAHRLVRALRDGRHVDARPAVDAGHDAHVERRALAQRPRAAELADEAVAVLGRDALEPRRAVEDLGGHVEDLAQALVGVGQPAVLGDGEDADGRGRGQRAEALLALGQGVLGGAALADVGHLREEVLRAAVGVAHHGHVQRDPRLGAVGAQVALLGAVGVLLAGGERAHRLAVGLVVGGVGDVAHRHARQLLGLAAQHRRQRVVDAHEAPVGARDGHADGGVLEGALEALLGVAQRRGLLVGADGDAELAVDADAAQAPAPAGLGRPEAQRQLEAVALARQQLLPRRHGGDAILGVQEVADELAEQLVDRHAEAPLERRVGEEDGPLESVMTAMSGVSSRTRAAVSRRSCAGSVRREPGTSRSSALQARY